MIGQQKSLTKKRGRPVGATHGDFVGLRLPSQMTAAIDTWAESQLEGTLSRSGAVRELIRLGLRACGVDVPELAPMRSLDERIERAKKRASKVAPSGPATPQKGLAMLKRGKASAGLAGLKARKKPKQ
jgi:hypothetical protein